MTNKFKVGDKIKTKHDGYTSKKGLEGTVIKVDGHLYLCEFPGWKGGHGGNGYGLAGDGTKNKYFHNEYNIELVQAAPVSKFKPGDKVRLIRNTSRACAGATGVVGHRGFFQSEVTKHWYLDIVWDRNGLDGGMGDGGYEERDFEFVTPASEPGRYIVVVEKNGKFAPAPTPREYTSLAQAETVAASMSEKHGSTFYVLKAVAKAVPPVRPKAEVVKL